MKKTIRTLLILIIAIGFISNSKACECPEHTLQELDSLSYRHEYILIGEIINIGHKSYSIKIIEVLKGNITEKQIFGVYNDIDGDESSCAFFPHSHGTYLLYLDRINTDKNDFYADQCEANRAISVKGYPKGFILFDDKKSVEWTNFWINELRKNHVSNSFKSNEEDSFIGDSERNNKVILTRKTMLILCVVIFIIMGLIIFKRQSWLRKK